MACACEERSCWCSFAWWRRLVMGLTMMIRDAKNQHQRHQDWPLWPCDRGIWTNLWDSMSDSQSSVSERSQRSCLQTTVASFWFPFTHGQEEIQEVESADAELNRSSSSPRGANWFAWLGDQGPWDHIEICKSMRVQMFFEAWVSVSQQQCLSQCVM